MPDVSLIDVLTGAKDTWATSATLLSIVPAARLYSFGVPEGTAYPYATIEPGDVSAFFGGTEYDSSANYRKTNKIAFTVYGKGTGTGAVDWSVLAQEMGDVFGWSVGNPAASWTVPNAVKVISAMPEVDEFKGTGNRVDGVEIMSYKSEFSVIILANRG